MLLPIGDFATGGGGIGMLGNMWEWRKEGSKRGRDKVDV